MREGVSVANFRRKTCVSKCLRTSWGTLFYFRESQHRKKLMHKGGIRILPKNFMDNKVSRRECHNFTSKNCCLTVPKKISLGNSFVFQTISCMEKKHEKQVFITIFCPSFSVSRFSRKSLEERCGRELVSQISIGKLVSHSA